jgi:glyoxylase-like metal-dependent hydrolase (beta-lactamase superfamily II)
MADIKIGRMMLGVCQTNCYFVYREGSSKVIFIDPADYGEQIFKAMKDNGFEVAAILLTHGHFDHIWGCSRLRQLTSAPVYAYEGEEKVLLSADLNVSADAGRACTVKANTLLKDGEEVTVEGMTFKLIATPGHTQGSCCYYFEEANMLISGDTLFEESVGRTDLPTGSMSTLVRSVKDKLFVLPDDTVVYPGHGDSTTIEHEKKYNPFI